MRPRSTIPRTASRVHRKVQRKVWRLAYLKLHRKMYTEHLQAKVRMRPQVCHMALRDSRGSIMLGASRHLQLLLQAVLQLQLLHQRRHRCQAVQRPPLSRGNGSNIRANRIPNISSNIIRCNNSRTNSHRVSSNSGHPTHRHRRLQRLHGQTLI